jgi:soluble lytic murein transglycosylase-like protein
MSVQDLVTSAANKYGVEPSLALGVAKTESRLDPNALSSKGAVGVMQLMPSSFPGVNVYDPETNIDAGVGYLAQLLNKYNGDTTLALAAYNAGPGKVNQYGGVPPFPETQNYIDKVMSWVQSSGNNGDTSSVNGDSGTDVGNVVPIVADFAPSDIVLLVGAGLLGALLVSEIL